jgi:drug/metabolite transporter (DMT)-like permease
MPIEPTYWFPSKRYGWGWGLPMTWQGWLVLAAFVALVVAGTFVFPPRKAIAAYILYIAVISVLLIGVCWLKGEPPRWRWGDDDGASQR